MTYENGETNLNDIQTWPKQYEEYPGIHYALLSNKQEEVEILARAYVSRGIIPVKHIEDAIHIAIATVFSIDVLVSLNFKHIVKLKTKREVNVVNVLLGYNQLEIVEPTML